MNIEVETIYSIKKGVTLSKDHSLYYNWEWHRHQTTVCNTRRRKKQRLEISVNISHESCMKCLSKIYIKRIEN